MSNITRFVQKIFGNTLEANPSNGLAQYGSLAAGSPTFTADPATIQALDKWLNGFASAFFPGSDQSPTWEDFNGLMYVVTRQLAYILQAGVPEYNAATTYYLGSLVNNGTGAIYKSLVNDNTGNPITNPTYWANLIEPKGMAKAWVTFDGRTGTVLSSYNIQSVTREARGVYLLQFSNLMTDSNYAWVGSAGERTDLVTDGGNNHIAGGHGNALVDTIHLRVRFVKGNEGTYEDCSRISIIVFGN